MGHKGATFAAWLVLHVLVMLVIRCPVPLLHDVEGMYERYGVPQLHQAGKVVLQNLIVEEAVAGRQQGGRQRQRI